MREHAPMPGAEHLAEPLRRRWSPSVFDHSHRLPSDQIETLLHAAQWSPSYGNTQPWGFLVAERGSSTHETLVRHLSRGNSGWVPRASVVFITAAQVAAEPGGKPPKAVEYSYYDLGQAAAHLTLQASAMGLWVHQFAGFDHAAVAAELGVPEAWQVMSGIAVGIHGDPSQDADPATVEREQRTRTRRELGEIAHQGPWGVPWAG